MSTNEALPKAGLGKSDRFYANPILRDEEWNRAKQPGWALMVLAVAIVTVAFFIGVYGGEPLSTVGWIIGILTIVIYIGLARVRRGLARRQLRRGHGQATS
jgi:amino acid transporter